MEEKTKVTPEEEVLAEAIKGVTDIDTNAGEAIPSKTDESNAEPENGVEKLQSELNEQKDKYIRLFAEFDNFKRRNAKERVELIQTAGKDVIFALLDVLDDCDRAEKQLQTSEDLQQIKEGIQLVFGKLINTLQSRGLKSM